MTSTTFSAVGTHFKTREGAVEFAKDRIVINGLDSVLIFEFIGDCFRTVDEIFPEAPANSEPTEHDLTT